MSSDILTIDLAYKALKEGLVVVDFNFNRFKLNSDKVIVKHGDLFEVVDRASLLTSEKEKNVIKFETNENILYI